MDMNGKISILAPQDVVWAALLDAEVLKECVPGCDTLTGNPDEGYIATVTQKVGPVKARFKGDVTLSDVSKPDKLTLSGQGKGGAAGFAKGAAIVSLVATAEGTDLSYSVEAKVGGKLAQLGSRVIDGFAKKMADAFFVRLRNALEESGEDTETLNEKPKGWFRRMLG